MVRTPTVYSGAPEFFSASNASPRAFASGDTVGRGGPRTAMFRGTAFFVGGGGGGAPFPKPFACIVTACAGCCTLHLPGAKASIAAKAAAANIRDWKTRKAKGKNIIIFFSIRFFRSDPKVSA